MTRPPLVALVDEPVVLWRDVPHDARWEWPRGARRQRHGPRCLASVAYTIRTPNESARRVRAHCLLTGRWWRYGLCYVAKRFEYLHEVTSKLTDDQRELFRG